MTCASSQVQLAGEVAGVRGEPGGGRDGGQRRERVCRPEPPVERGEGGAGLRRPRVAAHAIEGADAPDAETPLQFVPLPHHLRMHDIYTSVMKAYSFSLISSGIY